MKYRHTDYRQINLYKNISEEDRYDWRWQLAHAICNLESLEKILNLGDDESEHIFKCIKRFRISITSYYTTLMILNYQICPISLQGVSRYLELESDDYDFDDLLDEDIKSPVHGLTHRYPERGEVVPRNYEGVITTYNCGRCGICMDPMCKPLDGIATLLRGDKMVLRESGSEV